METVLRGNFHRFYSTLSLAGEKYFQLTAQRGEGIDRKGEGGETVFLVSDFERITAVKGFITSGNTNGVFPASFAARYTEILYFSPVQIGTRNFHIFIFFLFCYCCLPLWRASPLVGTSFN